MKDVLVILLTFGFFAVCVAYVALCDRIVGPDETPPPDGSPDTAAAAVDDQAVAGRPTRTATPVGGAR